jgi:phage-related protein
MAAVVLRPGHSASDPCHISKKIYAAMTDKPLRWMLGTLQTPPVGRAARVEAGVLLRRIQRGELVEMPDSRPMASIGKGVHELRVDDRETRKAWRIVYRIDPGAILVVHWFEKRTRTTPKRVIDLCRKRLGDYDDA